MSAGIILMGFVWLTEGVQVFLATKFGARMGQNGQREIRNDPEYIRMAVDRSLQRLRTDYIDLWYWYAKT